MDLVWKKPHILYARTLNKFCFGYDSTVKVLNVCWRYCVYMKGNNLESIEKAYQSYKQSQQF